MSCCMYAFIHAYVFILIRVTTYASYSNDDNKDTESSDDSADEAQSHPEK